MTLPPPDPAFHWTAESWGLALRCQPLSAVAQHLFTTKQLELRPPAAGDASGAHGPSAEAYTIAWTQAASAVGGGLEQLMRVKQVHGAGVRVLRQGAVTAQDVADRPEADAIVSNASGLVLSVQVADCVPILMADARSGACAAVHAGWRGTCAGVAGAAVERMVSEFGSDPSDLIAALGPSIGACCYTVGSNVIEAFRQIGASGDDIERWFAPNGNGSWQLDLWRTNVDQLIAAGLPSSRVHACRLCTRTHHDIFESYRVDGERAGRMAALIAVP